MAKIHSTLTSSGGCTVTIDGDANADYDWKKKYWVVISFTGTITLGGASGCPSGTVTFKHDGLGSHPNTDRELIATVHGDEQRSVSKITWRGSDPRVTALLNDPVMNAALCEQLWAATEDAEKVPRMSDPRLDPDG